MKTIPKTKTASRPIAAVLPWISLLSLALVAPLHADDAAAPKDHALFAGATVQMEDGPGYFEIVGARGSSISLLENGKPLQLRRDQVHNVRVERSLKLTDVIARIDQLNVAPTFVGPHEDRFKDLHMQMLMSDMAFDAQAAVSSGAAQIAVFTGTAALVQAQGGVAVSPAQVIASQSAYISAAGAQTSLQSSVDSFRNESDAGGNNALDIACELSTPRVLPNTYALVLTEFREADGARSSYNVDIEPVGELGPKPRKVNFQQTGFPANFIVGHVGVHLYSGRLELATNLSEGRVDLTADNAMRYLVLAYVASHPKDSLPAAPLRIALPADFKQQAPLADLNRTFYLTIGKDGRVQGLSADPEHPVAVNPYIESAVRNFLYEPAIKAGQPVASVVTMRLDTFVR